MIVPWRFPVRRAYASAQKAQIKPFKPNDLAKNIAWAWQASHGQWTAALQAEAVVAKIPDFRFSAGKFGSHTQMRAAGQGEGAGRVPHKKHSSQRLSCAVIVAAVLALPATSYAQSLQQELKSLLGEHPRIRAAEAVAKREAEGVTSAFSGFLPKVALTGDYGREEIDNPIRRNAGQGTSELNRNKATLTVTQNLFDGLKTPEAVKAAEQRKKAAEENLEATRQQMLLEGINAYYGVLRNTRLLRIAQDNENIIKRQLTLEDERVQRGSGIAVDVLLAKARLQLAVERRVAIDGALKEAIARYLQVFNHRPTISAMVDPNIDMSFLPSDMKSAIDQAVSGNPALRETDRRAEAAAYQVGVARSDYFPRLDLVGQGNREENVDTIAGLRRDWSVLLKFTWELFSGFATNASYNAAIYEKLNQQDIYLDRRRQVVQDLEIAWEALATARERVRLLDNAVSIAEEVFVARGRLRDSGRETAINVLDAQSELFGAQLNAVTASYDAQVTAFRVLAAMGALTPDNLKM